MTEKLKKHHNGSIELKCADYSFIFGSFAKVEMVWSITGKIFDVPSKLPFTRDHRGSYLFETE